jgi:hypothetical protein
MPFVSIDELQPAGAILASEALLRSTRGVLSADVRAAQAFIGVLATDPWGGVSFERLETVLAEERPSGAWNSLFEQLDAYAAAVVAYVELLDGDLVKKAIERIADVSPVLGKEALDAVRSARALAAEGGKRFEPLMERLEDKADVAAANEALAEGLEGSVSLEALRHELGL